MRTRPIDRLSVPLDKGREAARVRAPGRIKFGRWSVSRERGKTTGPWAPEIVAESCPVNLERPQSARNSGQKTLIDLQQSGIGAFEAVVNAYIILRGAGQFGAAVG